MQPVFPPAALRVRIGAAGHTPVVGLLPFSNFSQSACPKGLFKVSQAVSKNTFFPNEKKGGRFVVGKCMVCHVNVSK